MRPSLGHASSPMDWETSVSTDPCISRVTNVIFDSRIPGCWSPIRYCSHKVAGAAQRSLVSRRPFESNMDRRVVPGAAIHWGVGTTHRVCRWSDRTHVEFVMSLYEWSGGMSLSLLMRGVTHCVL